jgi:hypothetical protein
VSADGHRRLLLPDHNRAPHRSPHRIEIWYARDRDVLYLLAGGGDSSDWVRNLIADPVVSVEIDRVVQEARETIVGPGVEAERARSLVFD